MMKDLEVEISDTLQQFKFASQLIHRESWQALDVRRKPEMATFEMVGHSIIADLAGWRDLTYYRRLIKPDLPWADDHFAERISGQPLNPPPSEEWWPWAPKGNATFKKAGIFSHTYPERLWPKRANKSPGNSNQSGIRYPYGDLNDVIKLLYDEPYTRQAYIPIWFPEDTGNLTKERKPCTLGYHLLLTQNRFDIFYYIRSCDVLRHFRNDIYFTVRLMLWVLDRLAVLDSKWQTVRPNTLRMFVSSLHCFRNDWPALYNGERR